MTLKELSQRVRKVCKEEPVWYSAEAILENVRLKNFRELLNDAQKRGVAIGVVTLFENEVYERRQRCH